MTEKEFNQIFSENLTYYMSKTGTSRGDLAKLLNVSVTSVANWCRGQKTPRMDKVDRMCAHFGIKRSDLMSDPSSAPASRFQDVSSPTSFSPVEERVLHSFRQLNEEGQEKVVDYVRDLVASGQYIKTDPAELVEKA